MAGLETMLERIRQALGHSAAPGSSRSEPARFPPLPPDSIMPPIPPERLLAKFEEEMGKVGGDCHRASTRPELDYLVQTLLAGCGATEVVLSRNPLLAELDLAARLSDRGVVVSSYGRDAVDQASGPGGGRDLKAAEAAFRARCFSAGAGITGADFALAESGSLVLTSSTEGSQLASLAPPVHIALYRRRHLVAYLEQVLAALPLGLGPGDAGAGRAVVFITGPSRTADIEQVLIRGVHGPRQVHAILVEDACLA
ncbi:MAG TPA: lactate utilization protein [Terriglobia bacterium]|nr:lactate utilization protein [Terriglobia bacterium]